MLLCGIVTAILQQDLACGPPFNRYWPGVFFDAGVTANIGSLSGRPADSSISAAGPMIFWR